MERTQFRLGLVGYGEIGSTLGGGLRGAGLERVAAYDLHAFDGPYADLIQGRAREAGVALVRSNRELAEAADVIVSVTPGVACLASADVFAPWLTGRHVFADFASATPKIKVGVADRLAGTGARLADASIEGTPRDGHGMAVLSSGPAGSALPELLNPWGMNIACVGDRLGTASGIKIVRSVLLKGIEALTDEMLLAARHYGIEDAVLASVCKTMARPWMDTVERLIPSGAIHAERRAQEVEMSAEAVADAGVEPVMARAVADRLRWKAGLGLKDHFNGVVPPDYRTAVAALAAKIAERARERDA